jgi:hypothetical protein
VKAIKRGRPAYGKPTCHPRRKHHARGLCAACYAKLPDVKAREATRKKDRDWTAEPVVREVNKVIRNWTGPFPVPHEQFAPILAKYRE